MSIELMVRNENLAVVTLQIPSGGRPREATHVRVCDRGVDALGWNQLYATLVVQAQMNGQADDAAAGWARQIMLALGQVEGVQPDAMTLADLRYLLANLATLAGPGASNVVLAEDLVIEPILDDLEAREQDLGDPYSPVDEPDPSFVETFFTAATYARREGFYEGWWSPIEREQLRVGAPGGPGKLQALGGSSADVATDPLDWGDLDVDGTRRLMYLGQDRILDWISAGGSTRYQVWALDRAVPPDRPVLGVLIEEQAWRTIDAGHELIWLGRDLRTDPGAAGDLVLDWTPATGDYRVYRVDLAGTKSDGKTPDILPEPPLAKGTWTSIRAGSKLIYLGGDRVLDWQAATGDFRIWVLDRGAAAANRDPLPNLEVQGNWETIREEQQIINLGGDRVLTWSPGTGWYRIWRYDRSVKGTGDPLMFPPLAQGAWDDSDGHELVWLGGQHVLDWQPGSSAYRIRTFDRTVTSGDPLT